MTAEEPEIRYATEADASAILPLMKQYYSEDGYPFHEACAREALQGLLANPSLGRIWVMSSESNVVGYFAMTLGYSLEYLGRDAFLDELFVTPEWRGRGLGKRAVELAEQECRSLGVQALHLEVETHKERAYRLYEKSGFERHERHLMTKRLVPPDED